MISLSIWGFAEVSKWALDISIEVKKLTGTTIGLALQAISESDINDIFDKHDEEKLLEKSDKTMFDLIVARGK